MNFQGEKLRGQTSTTELSRSAARSPVWPYHLLAPDRSAVRARSRVSPCLCQNRPPHRLTGSPVSEPIRTPLSCALSISPNPDPDYAAPERQLSIASPAPSPPSRWTAGSAFCPTSPLPSSATLRRTLRRLEIFGPPPHSIPPY